MGRINRKNRPFYAKRRRLCLEPLEQRFLMDANGLSPDAFNIHQNSALQRLDVLQNDSFINLQISAVSYGSEGGTVRISEDHKAILYSPPADFFGTETFDYYTSNQLSTTVTVTVQSPLKSDDYQVFPTGEVKTLDVLANDPFWIGYNGPRKITAVGETLLGNKVVISNDGKYSVIYDADFRVRKRRLCLYC